MAGWHHLGVVVHTRTCRCGMSAKLCFARVPLPSASQADIPSSVVLHECCHAYANGHTPDASNHDGQRRRRFPPSGAPPPHQVIHSRGSRLLPIPSHPPAHSTALDVARLELILPPLFTHPSRTEFLTDDGAGRPRRGLVVQSLLTIFPRSPSTCHSRDHGRHAHSTLPAALL
ncbi:hypothetical protein LZ32DRAFT_425874 [Colletotrichum eremochloae]|nr:hypothetical protein LZ32DRAFT_425874 [Colletotrichum eremochloae]